MKPLAFALSVLLVTGPALAECRTYETGTGPELTFAEDGSSVMVDFGDWTEVCPLRESPRPVMMTEGLGFGSGWIEPMIAVCDQFETQVSFASTQQGDIDAPADLATFYGQIFRLTCP